MPIFSDNTEPFASDVVSEAIGFTLDTCHAHDLTSPLVIVLVGASSAVIVARYTSPQSGGEILAECSVPPGLKLPVNAFVTDGNDDAAHLRIDRHGATFGLLQPPKRWKH